MNICLRANTCWDRNSTHNMFLFSLSLNYINCTIKNVHLEFRVRSTFSFTENFDLCMLQQRELIKVSCFSALNDDTTGHIIKINRWFLLNMIAFNCSTFCFTHIFSLRVYFSYSVSMHWFDFKLNRVSMKIGPFCSELILRSEKATSSTIVCPKTK